MMETTQVKFSNSTIEPCGSTLFFYVTLQCRVCRKADSRRQFFPCTMNKNFKPFLVSFIILLSLSRCADESATEAPGVVKSQIEQQEKQSGVTFYKREIQVFDESKKSSVVMMVAAVNPDLVESYIREYNFTITPTYDVNETKPERSKVSEEGQVETSSPSDLEGVFTEFTKVSLQDGVTGFRTNAVLKNREIANGRTKIASDFPSSATHYNNSGNWPERFKMFAYQTVGWKFHGKSKWYSGWSTRTFCDWYDDTDCADYWEQASEKWIYIDGPWDVKATVYYFSYTDYSFEWNNF